MAMAVGHLPTGVGYAAGAQSYAAGAQRLRGGAQGRAKLRGGSHCKLRKAAQS